MSRYYRERFFSKEEYTSIAEEAAEKRSRYQQTISEQDYFERAYEQWAAYHANLSKPKKPSDVCLSTDSRLKTLPRKSKRMELVRPYQTKV